MSSVYWLIESKNPDGFIFLYNEVVPDRRVKQPTCRVEAQSSMLGGYCDGLLTITPDPGSRLPSHGLIEFVHIDNQSCTSLQCGVSAANDKICSKTENSSSTLSKNFIEYKDYKKAGQCWNIWTKTVFSLGRQFTVGLSIYSYSNNYSRYVRIADKNDLKLAYLTVNSETS